MEGKGPYRIYDPGGNRSNLPTHSALKVYPRDQRALMENMEGIKSLGDLLEESQNEASKLRHKAEALVKENKHLELFSIDHETPSAEEAVHTKRIEPGKTNSFFEDQISDMNDHANLTAPKADHKTSPSETSSEFEILNKFEKKTLETRKPDLEPAAQHEDNLRLHLQRLESSLSTFAEEPDRGRLVSHMSRMALDFNRLANKVHKNEQRTTVLQTLCEQLRKENEDLRAKLEADWNQRAQTEQALRYENLDLKKLILDQGSRKGNQGSGATESTDVTSKVENADFQQVAKILEKPANKDPNGALLKKVKVLEHQRTELLEVNKQWDHQFRSMKLQYEEKITSLRQKLSQALKAEREQEEERDRKQRDFDRKLLLARDKIEEKEAEIQRLESEINDLKQKNTFLRDHLNSASKQREYQEREISRLNKALEDALNLQGSAKPLSFTGSTDDTAILQRQELVIQNDILKQQVEIFEEDFQKERRDRERMNEEKEELKKQLVELKSQLDEVNSELRACQDDLQKAKENSRQQTTGERYIADPLIAQMCPPYHYPYSPGIMYPRFEDWQIRYPPPIIPSENSQDLPNVPPPAYQWRVSNTAPRSPHRKGSKKKETDVPAGAAQNPQRPT
ncbi:TNFAIP3-interacting protein 1 [Spea bombifrons]|uniref:TNFAIP3-interacting protein 1 n=1 Tax=Spea bombifrons TaxID=233779 RepID=UPI00234AC21C|nr:TNFAIP3-interacting protein 1 [Spea bombifrons]